MKNKIAIFFSLLLLSQISFSQTQTKYDMKKFKINIKESVLTDLQNRLKNTRWTDEPKNAEWNYGTNPTYLKELVTYWQKKYDWRKQEVMLNSFPQYKVTIDGVEIHFVYVKGKGKNPKSLLLTHGWPDCFYRFYKAIPMLTDPAANGGSADESFDVIVPSIPGFGFSQKIALNDEKVAVLFQKLMTEVLGYKMYVAAGGDIGSNITKSLANQFPKSIDAIHLTDVGYPTGSEDVKTMSKPEQEFVKFIQKWIMEGGAYLMLQSTKPQTLGYGLNDSPVGLASWILEKFYSWSDTKGNIENSFTKDELLTNIMIYWVTQTINTSIRDYYENAKVAYTANGPKPVQKVNVPTGVAIFPAEAPIPKEWAERMVNVKRFTKMEKGGHFAALEVPELWTKEFRSFFYSK